MNTQDEMDLHFYFYLNPHAVCIGIILKMLKISYIMSSWKFISSFKYFSLVVLHYLMDRWMYANTYHKTTHMDYIFGGISKSEKKKNVFCTIV